MEKLDSDNTKDNTRLYLTSNNDEYLFENEIHVAYSRLLAVYKAAQQYRDFEERMKIMNMFEYKIRILHNQLTNYAAKNSIPSAIKCFEDLQKDIIVGKPVFSVYSDYKLMKNGFLITVIHEEQIEEKHRFNSKTNERIRRLRVLTDYDKYIIMKLCFEKPDDVKYYGIVLKPEYEHT